LNHQIALRDLQTQIHFFFALDGARFDLFDRCGTVVGVDNRLANLKNHVHKPLSAFRFYHGVLFAALGPALPESRAKRPMWRHCAVLVLDDAASVSPCADADVTSSKR